MVEIRGEIPMMGYFLASFLPPYLRHDTIIIITCLSLSTAELLTLSVTHRRKSHPHFGLDMGQGGASASLREEAVRCSW